MIGAANKTDYLIPSRLRLHYQEQGTGEVIVLFYGFSGSSQTWVEVGVAPELAKDYRVIALDARGHGKTLPKK